MAQFERIKTSNAFKHTHNPNGHDAELDSPIGEPRFDSRKRYYQPSSTFLPFFLFFIFIFYLPPFTEGHMAMAF